MTVLQAIADHAPHLPRHDYTLRECIDGTAPVPQDPFGKGLFQLLVAVGMTTFMVTFNGVLHEGPSFPITSHWMYPLILCISLGMRFLFANRLSAAIAPHVRALVRGSFTRNVAMTAVNVAMMAPIMGCVVTMLMHGPEGFASQLAQTLPIAAPVSMLVNLFLVGPTVKMIYHNILMPSTGMRIFRLAQRHVTTWAGVFTS